MAFNEIPEEFVSNSTVYFLRDTKGMCPEELQPQRFQFCIKNSISHCEDMIETGTQDNAHPTYLTG